MRRRARRLTRLSTALRAVGFRGALGKIKVFAPPPPRHDETLPPLADAERETAQELREVVTHLATAIGQRNVYHPEGYRAAEAMLTERLHRIGGAISRQTFDVDGVECANVALEIPGATRPDEIVVVGAHYDSVELPAATANADNCPAANDNASGCAATVSLARLLSDAPHARTLRFVMFANEEPPFFWTEHMGSLVYANACKARGEEIVAMLTPETMGCYSDAPGSQRFPIPGARNRVGDRADFIAFAGMSRSADLIERCVTTFRRASPVRCLGAATPAAIPMVAASDHWGFWRNGYPALMVTDTAPFRYRYYHTPEDTPEKLNYEMMARVVHGLAAVVAELAGI